MEYRRVEIEGGTYFFTLATYNRRPFLCYPNNVELLRRAFQYTMQQHPMEIDAFVLLPDHLHTVWTLPKEDCNYSTRWRLIKSYFSRHCQEKYDGVISTSRQSKQERAFWQRRFWEHLIRDNQDFVNHVEYIHYNPVNTVWWLLRRIGNIPVFIVMSKRGYMMSCGAPGMKSCFMKQSVMNKLMWIYRRLG